MELIFRGAQSSLFSLLLLLLPPLLKLIFEIDEANSLKFEGFKLSISFFVWQSIQGRAVLLQTFNIKENPTAALSEMYPKKAVSSQ